MPSAAILSEVEHLHGVCTRLEGLAERTPRLTAETPDYCRKRAECRDFQAMSGNS